MEDGGGGEGGKGKGKGGREEELLNVTCLLCGSPIHTLTQCQLLRNQCP